MRIALIYSLFFIGIGHAFPWHGPSPDMEVSVNGYQIPKHYHQGTTYVEATKGKEYSLRISNPLGVRVAVALSVDGLNTINAQHTEARLGPKWVLAPYETIVIDGWQVNSQHARRFYFTNEAKSYGTWLGRTENLGVISAAFFREQPQPVIKPMDKPAAPAVPSPRAEIKSQHEERDASRADQPEYAATGIGNRVSHEVQRVYLNLEERPFATINLRYEFRPILVRLGVLPHITAAEDPLLRREKAKGFREIDFCPEP